MSEVLDNLNENLKQQVALYKEFKAQEKDKQNALLQHDLKKLDEITAQEERLLHEAGRLEKERLVWAEQIGRDLGKAPEELTLVELAEHFPILEEVRLELDRVVDSLQDLHRINAQLLEQSMNIVEFTLRMLTHQEKNTYTHPGRKENEGNALLHLLDRRI